MPKKKLTKKSSKTQSGFIKVKFSRNTTKSFKLKSAELGELQTLIIEVSLLITFTSGNCVNVKISLMTWGIDLPWIL